MTLAQDHYDVVVIGGGLGGLGVAAPLARLGRSVLLCERTENLGGCAHAFERAGCTFDPAVHYIGAVDGFVDPLLHALGVGDRVRFIPFDSMYGVDMPGTRAVLPLGVEPFIEAHERQFPGRAQGIAGFLEACVQMTRESQSLPARLDLKSLDAAAKQFPFLFRYRKATVQDVLDEHVPDPQVQAFCTAAWPYVGLPPSRLSFVTFAAMLMYVMEDGPQYCEGSFESLVRTLGEAVQESGGDIALGTPVERILIEDGRAVGIVTADGRRIGAGTVVSNADARQTFERLVGLEHLPARYSRRLERMTPSLSAFWLFAATDLDLSGLDLPHEMFIHHHWDHDRTYADVLAGRPGGMWLSVPSLVDPTVAPPGQHVVVLTSHMPYDIGESWSGARGRYEALMVEEVERIMPGFRDHVLHLESATPETFERWTGNHEGAIYGWESIPNQSTPKRLPRVSPVDGLLLSGAWTEPGAGAVRTLYSGLQTAQLILGYESGPALLGALGRSRAGVGV